METFSDSNRVVARWSEHELLNVPGDIDHDALDNTPQRITKTSLGEIPTMDEMVTAIAGLKDDKSPIYQHRTRGSSGDSMWLQR